MTTGELPQALRDAAVEEEVGRGGEDGAGGDQDVEAVPLRHRQAQETAAPELRRDVLQETVTGH